MPSSFFVSSYGEWHSIKKKVHHYWRARRFDVKWIALSSPVSPFFFLIFCYRRPGACRSKLGHKNEVFAKEIFITMPRSHNIRLRHRCLLPSCNVHTCTINAAILLTLISVTHRWLTYHFQAENCCIVFVLMLSNCREYNSKQRINYLLVTVENNLNSGVDFGRRRGPVMVHNFNMPRLAVIIAVHIFFAWNILNTI